MYNLVKKINSKQFPISLLVSSLTLVILGVIIANPFDITMNNMLLAVISGLMLACFGVFAGLFWHEKANDERETQIIDRSGKLAYLVGLSVLILGLLVQSFQHSVDFWNVLAIALMIISKHLYIYLTK